MALYFSENILPHGTASKKLNQLNMIPALEIEFINQEEKY